jgi:hypothetical protein
MSATIFCPGTVSTGSAGEPLCLDGGSLPLPWTVVPDFDPSLLDTPTMTEAFSIAFVMVATAWAIGKSVSLILSIIRR